MEDDGGRILKWEKHSSTLIDYFNTLLKSGMLADCTLVADGKYIKAHKAILCACSPYFERLLSEPSNKHPTLFLKDVTSEDLNDLVCYMYEGTVDIHQDRIASFVEVAGSLKIKGMTQNHDNSRKKQGASTSSKVPQQMGVASLGGAAIGDATSHSDPEVSIIDLTEDDDMNDSNQHPAGATPANDEVGAARESQESGSSSESEDEDKRYSETYKVGKYSNSENKRIIQYLIEKELIPTADLPETWLAVAQREIVNRPARGLEVHFLQYLLPQYKKYTSDDEACEKFQNLCQARGIIPVDPQNEVPPKRYMRWSEPEFAKLMNYTIKRDRFNDVTTKEFAAKIKKAKIVDREQEAIHKQLKRLFNKGHYKYYVTDPCVLQRIALGLRCKRKL